MALNTRQLSTTSVATKPASVPWRAGRALGVRLSRVLHAFTTWAAAAQLGPDRETEIGRRTGGRI